MSSVIAFRVGMLCVMLAILSAPPHDPAADGIIAGICAVYVFLLITGRRGDDA